jgi:hypothetical protein
VKSYKGINGNEYTGHTLSESLPDYIHSTRGQFPAGSAESIITSLEQHTVIVTTFISARHTTAFTASAFGGGRMSRHDDD